MLGNKHKDEVYCFSFVVVNFRFFVHKKMPSQEDKRLINALSDEELKEFAMRELGENPKQMEVSTYCIYMR